MSGGYERRLSAAQQDERINKTRDRMNTLHTVMLSQQDRVKSLESRVAERKAHEQFYKAAGWRGLWRRLVWVARG